MKKLLFLSIITLMSLNIYSQASGDYVSITSGNWGDPHTWRIYPDVMPASTAPDANTTVSIFIENGHTVTADAASFDNQYYKAPIFISGTLQFGDKGASGIAGFENDVTIDGGTLTNNATTPYDILYFHTKLKIEGNGNLTTTTVLAVDDFYLLDDATATVEETYSFDYTSGANNTIALASGTTLTIGSKMVFTEGTNLGVHSGASLVLNPASIEILGHATFTIDKYTKLYGNLDIKTGGHLELKGTSRLQVR